jgi:kumamolisin
VTEDRDGSDRGYVPVAGSERQPLAGARRVGPADPDELIEVSVYLKPPQAPAPQARRPLSRSEFGERHGARSEDLAAVEAFARENGLQVRSSDRARSQVVLAGTVAAMSRAFDVELHRYETDETAYRGRTGHVHVPAGLADVVTAVLGLDDRPQAEPRLVRRDGPLAEPAPQPFSPLAVASLYDFPTSGTGSGQCIGIVELGGGYRDADLAAYFANLGIDGPSVSSVSVDGASNSPSDANSDDVEVLLDIEVAGAVAPGARIVVYFAPNSDQGFADAVIAAAFDAVNKPSVLSISWGSAESNWTPQATQAMDQALATAAALGITVCVASGDNGSSDGQGDGQAHVDFPSSDPHVLGCGGTQLLAADGAIASETTWNDAYGATGGGVSDVFGVPGYQAGAGVPPSVNPGNRTGRGVPDVAGNADPATGFQILVDGQNIVVGGTSAVAPLWAGLIALINEQLAEPVGFFNPVLYEQVVAEGDGVTDVTGSGNGAYQAGQGWDACTGLGTPRGEDLLAALIY